MLWDAILDCNCTVDNTTKQRALRQKRGRKPQYVIDMWGARVWIRGAETHSPRKKKRKPSTKYIKNQTINTKLCDAIHMVGKAYNKKHMTQVE
jgi:hypothetical protein